jgi:hypothetical protein
MKFGINRMKFVLATEKFDRRVAELIQSGKKFDRPKTKFGVRGSEFLVNGKQFAAQSAEI